MAPFLLGGASDEVPSTSCAEGEESELLRVRDSSAQSRGVWKIAVVAAAAGLIAVAGTWWARDESLGKDGTGLATEYYRYDTIGCSNWESIEISRASGLTLAGCQELCDADATCVSINFQADPCEPGYYVAGGCILFKDTCMTQRNYCWELDYKVNTTGGNVTVVVVTQQVTTTWPANTPKLTVEESAFEAFTALSGVPPNKVTATLSTRRLGKADDDTEEDWDLSEFENEDGELRKLQSQSWVTNATWLTTNTSVAAVVEEKTEKMASGDPVALATFNEKMPPEAEKVTADDVEPPTKKEESVDPAIISTTSTTAPSGTDAE